MTDIQSDNIKQIVKNFLFKNITLIETGFINEDIIEHVINTGKNILAHKWNLTHGGDFAYAIVNNNLLESYMKADDINTNFIKFYTMLVYNITKPIDL